MQAQKNVFHKWNAAFGKAISSYTLIFLSLINASFHFLIFHNKKVIICAIGRVLPVAINLDCLVIYECCLFVYRVMMHLIILFD